MGTASACIVLGLATFLFPLQAVAESVALPDFAWPVEGQVIDEDDAHPSPASSEGIDILVPEGTEVVGNVKSET